MFYLDLFKALKSHEIDYLLIGGLAMNLHGVPRMTMDVDLIVAMETSNINKLILCMSELGLRPNVPVKVEDLADKTKCESLFKEKNLIALSLISNTPATPTVDIVIHHPLNFQQAYANKVARDISGIPML